MSLLEPWLQRRDTEDYQVENVGESLLETEEFRR